MNNVKQHECASHATADASPPSHAAACELGEELMAMLLLHGYKLDMWDQGEDSLVRAMKSEGQYQTVAGQIITEVGYELLRDRLYLRRIHRKRVNNTHTMFSDVESKVDSTITRESVNRIYDELGIHHG